MNGQDFNGTGTGVAVPQQNWWETAQNKLDSQFLEQFDLSTQSLIEIAAYSGIGFLIGFLTKRYGRTMIVTLVALGAMFWLLSYVNVTTIHWDQVRLLLGVDETATFDSFFQLLVNWTKDHVKAVVSGLIGFFVGYKIG